MEVRRRCELVAISGRRCRGPCRHSVDPTDYLNQYRSALGLMVIADPLCSSVMLEVQLLKEARRRAGLTQRELAERLGTTQSSIARIESGVVSPTFATLRSAIEACGFEIRVGLGEPDLETDSLFNQTLALSPAERIRQAARVVRFGRRLQEARRTSPK
jgi:transcriptional regulator with XRE-family HTH domain